MNLSSISAIAFSRKSGGMMTSASKKNKNSP
jgi:hypothetical protein